MALEVPLWSTGPMNNEFQHSAFLDRRLSDALFTSSGGVVGLNDLKVVPRGLGANMSVDIASGVCIIPGSSIAYQGKYLCRSTDIENRVVSAAPSTGTRTDTVVARIRDSEVTGIDDGFFLEVLNNTTIVPADAIPLARISIPAGTASIQAGNITDLRPSATISHLLLNYDDFPDPVQGGNLVNKDYVDHNRNHRDRQTVNNSTTNFDVPTSGTWTLNAGAVTLPTGWNSMDVEFYCYMEFAMIGATYWRYSFNVKAFTSGSWSHIHPVSSHTADINRDSNTSGIWAYGGGTNSMFGYLTNVNSNINMRYEQSTNSLRGTNSSILQLRSTRRYIFAVKSRRT